MAGIKASENWNFRMLARVNLALSLLFLIEAYRRMLVDDVSLTLLMSTTTLHAIAAGRLLCGTLFLLMMPLPFTFCLERLGSYLPGSILWRTLMTFCGGGIQTITTCTRLLFLWKKSSLHIGNSAHPWLQSQVLYSLCPTHLFS